jgi:helix-hairpin-helix protein
MNPPDVALHDVPPRREGVRGQYIAIALLLSALTACSMYGRVIPHRPPTGIDLNRATAEQIADLPGLSEADAERIVGNRPYATKDDLVRRGVLTEERFEAIQDRVYLSRPSADTTKPRA